MLFKSYTDNNTDKKVNFTINFKKGMLKENNIKENFGLIIKFQQQICICIHLKDKLKNIIMLMKY